jgi:predicted NAD/FAD-dependent oxidoreductase
MTADVAVIGAGIAGLAAADALRRAGRTVVVFEKSRGIGGRLATRRSREGFEFDHGAPVVHRRPAPFALFLEAAEAAGDAAHLNGDMVGLPGMSSLPRRLAAGLDIRFGTEVTAVRRTAGGWQVATGDSTQTFAAVVCTAPAPQTARLCAGEPAIAGPAATARMSPCWTLMAAWARTEATEPVVWATGPLEWAHRVDAKPGRDRLPTRWVAHARLDWTTAHLEDDAAAVEAALLPLLAAAVNAEGAPLYRTAHRWRFARAAAPLGVPCLAAPGGLVAAGDWVAGPEAGDAYASGLAAAAALGA